VLADGKTHPAPWARLDRQFLIKLQGEDTGARKASSTEIAEIEKLERDLGFKRSVLLKGSELAVDELMRESVYLLRLALKRHSDRARISFNLTATNKLLSGDRENALDSESRIELVADMLVLWRALFSGDRWTDEWATKQWQDHIQPLLGDVVLPEAREEENETAQKRKKRDEDLRIGLKRVADKLASNPSLSIKLNILWAARWQEEDTQWRPRLRWIRDWLMPRGVGRDGKIHQSIRHVGGLSLSRIATFKSLYQLEKSFKMRPEPDDLRKNVPKPGDESARKFGQRILNAMESMRENRVKQLASRIAEAALGIGREEQDKDGRQRKRPQQRISAPQFAPCHAVVIENLTHYRPEETRTRRENQQLMIWSSSKVKKYLSEACQLNGLHLREVPASYTSRQDSRTGAPGIRCKDVLVKDFLESPFWHKQITAAGQKVRDGGNGDSRERYLLALRTHWAAIPDAKRVGRSVRIPYRSGEVFVSAKKNSPASSGLQADLNAAANIGLKALLDPDWSGRWWYVPCDAETYRPVKDKIGGCLAINPTEPLIQIKSENAQSPDTHTLRQKRNAERHIGSQRESKGNILNLWRDISAQPVNNERAAESEWQPYSKYRNKVQLRVVNILREKAGLPLDSSTD
jgi:IS605 OrfB family transposase